MDRFLDFVLDCFVKCQAVKDTEQRIVDFQIEFINASACEFFSVPKEKITGNLLSSLVPSARFTEIFSICTEVVLNDHYFEKESLIYDDLSGNSKHLLNIRAAKQGDGLMVVWRDLSALGIDVSQLEKSELQFRQMVTEYTDGLFVIDSAGKIILVNFKAEKLFGKSAAELRGTRFEYSFDYKEPKEITILRKDSTLAFAEMKAVKIPWEG